MQLIIQVDSRMANTDRAKSMTVVADTFAEEALIFHLAKALREGQEFEIGDCDFEMEDDGEL